MIEKILEIKKQIEKYNKIILMCHLVPDHDSVGSTNALKKMIALNYPNKEVKIYAQNSSFFEQFSPNIKYDSYKRIDQCLYIALDCANEERLSWNEVSKDDFMIKIDHHPPINNYANINLVDDQKSSTCEFLWEIFKIMNVQVNKDICTLLYLGIIGDTGRFLYKNTSSQTYKCVSEMFKYDLNPQKDIYPYIYSTCIKDIKTKSQLLKKLLLVENFGIVMLTNNILNNLKLNSSDVSKFTNHFGNISELQIWIVIIQEEDYYKCSIRSKKYVINDIAQKFGGGGHPYASGVKLNTLEEVFSLINMLASKSNCNIKCKNFSCYNYLTKTLKSE